MEKNSSAPNCPSKDTLESVIGSGTLAPQTCTSTKNPIIVEVSTSNSLEIKKRISSYFRKINISRDSSSESVSLVKGKDSFSLSHEFTFAESRDMEDIVERLTSGDGGLIEIKVSPPQQDSTTQLRNNSFHLVSKIKNSKKNKTQFISISNSELNTATNVENKVDVKKDISVRINKTRKSLKNKIASFFRLQKKSEKNKENLILLKSIKAESKCKQFPNGVKKVASNSNLMLDSFTQTEQLDEQDETNKDSSSDNCTSTCSNCIGSFFKTQDMFYHRNWPILSYNYLFRAGNNPFMRQPNVYVFRRRNMTSLCSSSCSYDSWSVSSESSLMSSTNPYSDMLSRTGDHSKRKTPIKERKTSRSLRKLRLVPPVESRRNKSKNDSSMLVSKDTTFHLKELIMRLEQEKELNEFTDKVEMEKHMREKAETDKDSFADKSIRKQLKLLSDKVDDMVASRKRHGAAGVGKVDAGVECQLKVSRSAQCENLANMKLDTKKRSPAHRLTCAKLFSWRANHRSYHQHLLNKQREEIDKLKSIIMQMKEDMEGTSCSSQQDMHFWYSIPKTVSQKVNLCDTMLH